MVLRGQLHESDDVCSKAWQGEGGCAQGKGGRSRGKQVYLGGWENENAAARAYDLAAIAFWHSDAVLNVRSCRRRFQDLACLCSNAERNCMPAHAQTECCTCSTCYMQGQPAPGT